MSRVYFVLNPAGSHSLSQSELERLVVPLRRGGYQVEIGCTERAGHGTELARSAVDAGFDTVVAAGGDGTMNEVVQALAGTEATMGVLPLGTGNVWVHEVGIPLDLPGAVKVLMDGQVRRVDLGMAGERYFLLMAGVGYDAIVAQSTPSAAKRRLGTLAYVVRGIGVALSYRGRRVTLDVDGEQRQFRSLLIVIGNTRTYGGQVSLTPKARVDDGLLDVCVFRGVGLLHSVWFLLQVLIGRHTQDPGVAYFRTKRLMVRAEPPLLVQVDGDTIGETPMGFVVRNRCLKVIVPRSERPDLFSADEGQPDTD